MSTFGRRKFGGILLSTALAVSSITYGAGSARAVEVGERAPDFKLTSTMGGKISLSDYRDKKWVLLEFYGVDFSPV